MPSRHRSRERALQILYLWDMRGELTEGSVDVVYQSLIATEDETPPERDSFTDHLIRGAIDSKDEIDKHILEHSEHWRLERMPVVDRNILRLAVFEMLRESTPPAVVIDEALELARRFSTEESVSFINGVLDAVRRGIE